MPAGKVEVKGLFATSVAVLMLPNADRLNAEAAILRRRSERQTLGASNIGGWRSTRDLASWGGKPAEHVLAAARLVAVQLTADRDVKHGEFDIFDPSGPARTMHVPTLEFVQSGSLPSVTAIASGAGVGSTGRAA